MNHIANRFYMAGLPWLILLSGGRLDARVEARAGALAVETAQAVDGRTDPQLPASIPLEVEAPPGPTLEALSVARAASTSPAASPSVPATPPPATASSTPKNSTGPGTVPRTRYLLVGGGTAPFNTHVSLEEHLGRVWKGLLERQVPPALRRLFFAGGPDSGPVVEVLDPGASSSELQDLLAFVFDRTGDRNVTWRPTTLTDISGAATRAVLKQELERHQGAERTLLYVAGHGFAASSGRPTLGLWNNERLTPRELTRWLEPLPAGHEVVMVLAQCYSGAFADSLYTNADTSSRLLPGRRCGFFAAPDDRVSSGCTPEANRTDPDDYSTWFFSALERRRPDGTSLPSNPDVDGDGLVRLSEAHAFARVHDGTLDVPTSSSEAWLERRRELLKPEPALFEQATLASVLATADPVERSVLSGLATRLHVFPTQSLKEIRGTADKLKAGVDQQKDKVKDLENRLDGIAAQLRNELLQRWPWLVNPFHPQYERVLSQDGDAIVAFLKAQPALEQSTPLRQSLAAARAESQMLQQRQAVWERLARAMERGVMEGFIRQFHRGQPLQELEKLMSCEAGTF